jgi:hypothetical protein
VCGSAKKKKRKEGFIMKKILFVLLVLCMAAPAWASLDISCEKVGDTNEVIISFDATSEDPNLLRAIALDIQCDNDGKILDAKCKGAGGFWVSPGKAAGNVNTVTGEIDYEEPNTACVCPEPGPPPGTHPDTLPGLVTDSNGITIEMATLYDGAAPSMSGELIRLYVDGTSFNIAISENVIRGGAVMEDADAPVDANCTGCAVDLGCIPSGHPDRAEWLLVGQPPEWCGVRHCHGDADAAQELIGHTYFWVGFNDLGILVDNWADALGVPAAYQADFSHSDELIGHTYFRVGFVDLGVLVDNWADALGSNPDCLDVP